MGEESINLGLNIQLVGFNNIDKMELSAAKKIIGSMANKIKEKIEFEELKIRLKTQKSINVIYQIDINLNGKGKSFNAISEDRNLFIGLNEGFKRIFNEIEHNKK